MRAQALVLSCSIAFLGACTASGYKSFYKEIPQTQDSALIKYLDPKENPKIIRSENIKDDLSIAFSKGYIPIGTSSFNGELESETKVIEQAKRVGASLVLVNAQFTDAQSSTIPIILPSTQTTRTTGSVGGLGVSGVSTTYGTTSVPMIVNQRRFDQEAIYFAVDLKKYKYGLSITDLPKELRLKYERNTGAFVQTLRDGSPAFLANVLMGDVIVEVDEKEIINAEQCLRVMDETSPADGISVLKIIRNGEIREVKVDIGRAKN
jgi:hypothetical protein